jgi:hypothetical protein
MARGRLIDDVGTLQMALVGFQIEKQRIEAKIQELQAQLKGRRAAMPSGGDAPAPRKRELSEAARKRIANAQKKRWAEHRKRAAQAAKQNTKSQAAKAGAPAA